MHNAFAITREPRVGSWLDFMAYPPRLDRGGHPVIVLPGLLASDVSTVLLRAYLGRRGYRALPWGFGQNRGPVDDLLARLVARVRSLAHESGQTVSLVGHSLGGIYAREIAKIAPESVQLVMTLGSPFRANRGTGPCRAVIRLIERTTGRTLQELISQGTGGGMDEPPPVRSIAFYSKSDRIAHWEACMEIASPLAENVEVFTSHQRMLANPSVFRLIADHLDAHTTMAWPDDDDHAMSGAVLA